MKQKLVFKGDRFKKNRGGHSRWLLLSCEKCKANLMVYQKDGPGILKRLYVDRIVSPENIDAMKTLVCRKCTTVLGVPMVYEKEDRPAIRLFVAAIAKKIVKTDELPKIDL